ncbi:MAG: chemotaxis signal transduction protein [Planctomycetaceae bacterium]
MTSESEKNEHTQPESHDDAPVNSAENPLKTTDDSSSIRDAAAVFLGADMLGVLDQQDDSAEGIVGGRDHLIGEIDSQSNGAAHLEDAASGNVTAAADLVRCIVFTLDETRYAVAMDNVVEVDRLPAITSIPNVPAWIEGLANLRGEIISVVDLRQFLNMEALEFEQSRRMLTVRSHNTDLTTSLIVDRVVGIRTFPKASITKPASPVHSNVARFLSGVVEHDGELLAVFDLEKMLQDDAIRQFEALAV